MSRIEGVDTRGKALNKGPLKVKVKSNITGWQQRVVTLCMSNPEEGGTMVQR